MTKRKKNERANYIWWREAKRILKLIFPCNSQSKRAMLAKFSKKWREKSRLNKNPTLDKNGFWTPLKYSKPKKEFYYLYSDSAKQGDSNYNARWSSIDKGISFSLTDHILRSGISIKAKESSFIYHKKWCY